MDPRVQPELPSSRPRRSGAEDSTDVRRYLDALRRRAWMILLLGFTALVTAVAVSSWMPDRYRATVSIVKQVTTGPGETVPVDALTRELATIEKLLLTADVLDNAAKRVPGESPGSVKSALESSVDPDANLIFVTATAGDPKRAARDRQRGRRHLRREAARRHPQAVRAGPRQAAQGAGPGAGPAGRRRSRCRRSSSGSVSWASRSPPRAWICRSPSAPPPPNERSSPKPFRNGVLALFLGLFIGVLVALGRDQLVPRVSGHARAQPADRPAAAGHGPLRAAGASAGAPSRSDRDRVRDLPDARRPRSASRCRRSGPPCRARHERAARRGQEHRHGAPRRARSPRRGTGRCSCPPTCAGRRCTSSSRPRPSPG